MCYSHNQYNSLTPCVCPEQGYMQGETTAVIGEKATEDLCMCYSHNQYNSLTSCVCPEQDYIIMQGEMMAVKVRIKLLRISLIPRPSAQVKFT